MQRWCTKVLACSGSQIVGASEKCLSEQRLKKTPIHPQPYSVFFARSNIFRSSPLSESLAWNRLKKFHLNGHITGFHSQTWKLELQSKLPDHNNENMRHHPGERSVKKHGCRKIFVKFHGYRNLDFWAVLYLSESKLFRKAVVLSVLVLASHVKKSKKSRTRRQKCRLSRCLSKYPIYSFLAYMVFFFDIKPLHNWPSQYTRTNLPWRTGLMMVIYK